MLKLLNTQVKEQISELDKKDEQIESLKKYIASLQRENMQLRRRLELLNLLFSFFVPTMRRSFNPFMFLLFSVLVYTLYALFAFAPIRGYKVPFFHFVHSSSRNWMCSRSKTS